MKNIITIDRVLDYYDVPQLFLGRDKFDTQYLCLLYEDEPVCRYTAIRISTEQYARFVQGKTDLRSLYLTPEFDNEYFEISAEGEDYVISPLSLATLPEERLPLEGYLYDDEESETITITIPKRERSFFESFIHRHGWVAM